MNVASAMIGDDRFVAVGDGRANLPGTDNDRLCDPGHRPRRQQSLSVTEMPAHFLTNRGAIYAVIAAGSCEPSW
jgi:hypothetical protein